MTRLVAPPAPAAATPGRAAATARALHPWSWWGWALCAAAAISLTTNLALLAMCLAAVVVVVMCRRTRAPWARAVRAYLGLAATVLAIRMVFQVVLGSYQGGAMAFRLPELQLPSWLAGLHVGGPVGVDMLVATLADATRLAGVLVCVGAANALANPRRALRNVPAALHEVSTAVVISLTVAPQLIESGQRVRAARRLRGGGRRGGGLRGVRGLVSLLVPVLEDAIDRSLSLAGSMEARGYGRTSSLAPLGAATLVLLLGGMMSLVLGAFCFLGVAGATSWAAALMLAGVAAVVVGLRTSGRRLAVSHYRPDAWQLPETLTVAAGAGALVLTVALQRLAPAQLQPSFSPAGWPSLHPLMPVVAALLALPAFATPAPGRDDL